MASSASKFTTTAATSARATITPPSNGEFRQMLAIRARYSALIYPKAEALMKGAQEVMNLLQRMQNDMDALLVRPKTRDQAARKAERHPIKFFETKEDAKL